MVSSQFFVYDEAGHLTGSYNGSGAVIAETVWLDDLPVAVFEPARTILYRARSSWRAASDHRRAAVNVVWLWDHDPFGNGPPIGHVQRQSPLPGQFYDQNAKLHYNYFRDYDPNTGRYIESDPIGLRGGINTYSYVFGNPINLSDPFGLFSVSPAVIEQALARAGLAEAIGGGPEDPAADIAAILAAIGTIVIATDGSHPDSAQNLMPVNPGKDCNGKCKPCRQIKRGLTLGTRTDLRVGFTITELCEIRIRRHACVTPIGFLVQTRRNSDKARWHSMQLDAALIHFRLASRELFNHHFRASDTGDDEAWRLVSESGRSKKFCFRS